MELLSTYLSSLSEDQEPSVFGFLNWPALKDSPTLGFVTELTLNVALAIYVQRIGDRNNDHICSSAYWYKFYKTFYGFNHPIYREVEYNELRQQALYPSEIANLREENISFSSSKCESKNHEGGDFKLENMIKKIKAITPKGKKDEEMWKRTIRASPSVSKVLQHGKNSY